MSVVTNVSRSRKVHSVRFAMYSIVVKAILYLLATCGAIIFTLPFLWMISTSLKPELEVFSFPPEFIPKYFLWNNYKEAWSLLPFTTFLKNSIMVTFFNVLGNLLSCSLVAFGFSRLRSRYSGFLFMLLISTMMIPPQVTMVPLFVMFYKLGWVNTFMPLMVPPWLGYPFFIFMLRQFFATIPMELDDAARIDGCSTWKIYWSIILPLAKPALAAVAIFGFVGNWNDFMGPLIYLNSQEKYTLALGLQLFRGQYFTAIHYMMAVSVVTVLPIIIVFFIGQKYFIRGITLTGLKA